MSVLKCKMCGGSLAVEAGKSVAVCEYCSTRQTLPRLEDERIAALYERAELLRSSSDFDKAASVYEQIVSAAPTDAEAYWSLVLCRYGIEYVEDPSSHKRVPTINRIQYGSVLDDADYLSALQHADAEQKAVYEAEARAIEAIQKGFLAISMKEKPFDVFICYKETDNNGRRTPDSVLANDLYHQLTQEGFKVFFSRITLEDKLGTEYEPYIFAALNSAKVMVVLGTKSEYFIAPWVRNEWSRFHALIKNGEQKTLIPAYRDMNPYDLPEEFAHLQALDMSRLGFMQDLIRGIQKILGNPQGKVVEQTASDNGLLRRGFLYLEDGNWKNADAYFEKALDQEPEHAEAYLGKLMVKLRVRKAEDLACQKLPFEKEPFYEKAIRFGDGALVSQLTGYNEAIRRREREKEQEKLAEAAKKAEEAKAKKEKLAADLKANSKKFLAAVLAIAIIIGCIYGGRYIKEVQEEKALLAAQQVEEERKAAEEEARLAAEAEGAEKAAEEEKNAIWETFRNAVDGEPQDLNAAAAALEALSKQDAERADDGWYELAKVYYKKGLPKEAAENLSKISDLSRFEDAEKLQEDIRLLDIYVQAKEIKVTNEETKAALQELLDQLPEDYRKVAELRKQIEEFEKAEEEEKKTADREEKESENNKIEDTKPKETQKEEQNTSVDTTTNQNNSGNIVETSGNKQYEYTTGGAILYEREYNTAGQIIKETQFKNERPYIVTDYQYGDGREYDKKVEYPAAAISYYYLPDGSSYSISAGVKTDYYGSYRRV